MTNSDWIGLSAALATFIGVAVGLAALWVQISKLNQQLMLQHFADYTKRYQEIILRFPEDINVAGLPPESGERYEQVMRRMRAYFDLCYEEWYLNQRRLLDKGVWVVWKGGMEAALSKPAFKQAWTRIMTDTSFGASFEEYIDGLNKKADVPPTRAPGW